MVTRRANAAVRALTLTLSRARGGTGEGSLLSTLAGRARLINALLVATAVVVAGSALVGCPNSVLYNAVEAGVESLTEPTPTPTALP